MVCERSEPVDLESYIDGRQNSSGTNTTKGLRIFETTGISVGGATVLNALKNRELPGSNPGKIRKKISLLLLLYYFVLDFVLVYIKRLNKI